MRRREHGLNLIELMIVIAILVVLYGTWIATVFSRGWPLWYVAIPPGILGAYFVAVLTWVELESRRKKKTE